MADLSIVSKVEELLSKFETAAPPTQQQQQQQLPVVPILSDLLGSYVDRSHSTSNSSIIRTLLSDFQSNKPGMYVGRVQRISCADFGTKKY